MKISTHTLAFLYHSTTSFCAEEATQLTTTNAEGWSEQWRKYESQKSCKSLKRQPEAKHASLAHAEVGPMRQCLHLHGSCTPCSLPWAWVPTGVCACTSYPAARFAPRGWLQQSWNRTSNVSDSAVLRSLKQSVTCEVFIDTHAYIHTYIYIYYNQR